MEKNSFVTVIERQSELEFIASRGFKTPAQFVFNAWTKPELFSQWWAPKSMGAKIISCAMDVRIGGGYRIEFGQPNSDQPMAFFGSYSEVEQNSRLVWSNDESGVGALTTLTLEEKDGITFLVLHERHPTKEACDDGFSGTAAFMPEQFEQLEALLKSSLMAA